MTVGLSVDRKLYMERRLIATLVTPTTTGYSRTYVSVCTIVCVWICTLCNCV